MSLYKLYSTIEIDDSFIQLQSYEQNKQQSLKNPVKVPVNDEKHINKAIIKRPNIINIYLSPQEIIYKNLSLPFTDDKLINQVIRFEHSKYFNIKNEELSFAYRIWKKEEKESWVTLFAVQKQVLNQYLPLIQAGGIPIFHIKNYYAKQPGLNLYQDRTGDNLVLLAYFQHYLIAWIICEKKDFKPCLDAFNKYLVKLNFSPDNKPKPFHSDLFCDHPIDIQTDEIKTNFNELLKKRFNIITKAFIGLFICFIIIFQFLNINAKKNNLKKIKKLFNQYKSHKELNIADKKINLPKLTMGEIINKITKKLSPHRKIDRFTYMDNRIKLFIRETDELKLSKLKESLASEPFFSEISIEEGPEKDDKRILFKIKR